MTIKPRHMKKYTPRRRKSNHNILKQQIKDFEHLLDMDLSSFLILSEEGTKKQVEQARLKMRRDLLKYGSDMESVARNIGEGFPEVVRNYVKSLMKIIQNSSGEIDPALLNEYRKIFLRLSAMSKIS